MTDCPPGKASGGSQLLRAIHTGFGRLLGYTRTRSPRMREHLPSESILSITKRRPSMSCHASSSSSDGQASPPLSVDSCHAKTKSKRCWFGCVWLTRVSLMGTAVSTSPEPEETLTVLDRMAAMLNEKPLKMAHMLKVAKWINDASSEEKVVMFDIGIVHTLCELIADTALTDGQNSRNGSSEGKRRVRRNSSSSLTHRGVGFGHGSTRSRWDIERTVEERLAREEHLTWLLNAMNAYILSWPLSESNLSRPPSEYVHMNQSTVRLIGESAIIALLEYNLRNDSVFDVSEHMELYQSLMETAACMSTIPALVPYLVKPYLTNAKSIAKELVPRFNETMSSYSQKWRGQLGSPDFRMMDFINKIEIFSKMIVSAAQNYESDLPAEMRTRCSSLTRPTASLPKASETTESDATDLSTVYRKSLLGLQMQTFRQAFKISIMIYPSILTKRIAKELASMTNALPLNASNSIFVCVDEGRCDIIKVLISGPDDTPYANGLFEFDIFFPTGYPFAPPKCSFLTTGAGNVRFNPNLYNDGKICLSILGTWEGRPEEKWNPYCSLIQVLVSIQGLIFVKDPYFNEPGFEKYQGTEKGDDYSRKYNLQIEHATLNYAIREQFKNPPAHFKQVVERHFWLKRHAIIEQAKKWMVEMRKDVAETEKNPRRKESISFENVYNPFNQERVVQQLINEFSSMTCPMENGQENSE
ncbi:unnamed protein product [Caenorhabditis auriculariae]|uniref:UBC core domain-containing protein n=1 Tax=Caenorhabditis auriculariae TaxID=2777116 RepID=A0A8S1H1F9_9PELO|nr:unnamed protein product [Caenorhabditis auriculariae]